MPHLRQLSRRERCLARNEILRWHQRAWAVHALSVMPDHVHILATPLEGAPGQWYALPDIMQRVKGRSSRQINRLHGRRGTLWQKESYDRIMRDGREFDIRYNYLLSNAGVAGLIGPLEEYDGFWCESMGEIPEAAKATPDRPLVPRPLHPLVGQALACPMNNTPVGQALACPMNNMPVGQALACPSAPEDQASACSLTPDLGRPLLPTLPPEVLLRTRRCLPHWQLAGSTYFIVFCLLGRSNLGLRGPHPHLP